MALVWYPQGVCSRKFEIELTGNIISQVRVEGGCHGNSQGIVSLLIGTDAREAVRRMAGIRCERKATSCPDQLSKAIEAALEQQTKGEVSGDE